MQALGRQLVCSSNSRAGVSIIHKVTKQSSQKIQHHQKKSRVFSFPHRRAFSSTSSVSGGLLHHEWVIGGNVINDTNSANSRDDTNTVVFLHGLLGSGKNLRTLSKKITERNPNLSALLLDLRGHGSTSTNASLSSTTEPPHTFESCANDIINTLQNLNLVGSERSPVAVVGHSFGGRLALQYAHQTIIHNQNRLSSDGGTLQQIPHPPLHTWILDSVPGQAHASVHDVIQAVSSVDLPIPSKKHLQTVLTKEKGIDPMIAAWMTTNLRKSSCNKGFTYTFDLDVAMSVLNEFGKQDFLGMIRDVGKIHHLDYDKESMEKEKKNGRINLVMAGKNPSWTEDLKKELELIQSNLVSKEESFLQMYKLPEAGHWVHVDDLEGLIQVIEKGGLH
uniref:AB hydrolase-1 domain-containing protein n=1 Tax=Ditylum brightwellii TaxID=49249 RepID=A0A6V2AUR0_9STRA